MWRATVRGLFARKVRLALTALAIVLGVAFVSGTYVLTDTLKQSFSQVFAQTAANVDLVVRSAVPFDSDGGGDGVLFGSRARMPDSVVADVRAVPGVAAAEGSLIGSAPLIEADGSETIARGGVPSLGFSWSSLDGAVGPLRIVSDGASRPPQRDGEVAIDLGTAQRQGFELGDEVLVVTADGAESFEIVGFFGLGDSTDFGALTVAAFDPATAQAVFDAEGLVDQVIVKVGAETTPAAVQQSLERQLGPGYEVSVAADVAAEIQQPVDEFLDTLNNALLGFAGVGLLVGAFIIFNTFTILVSQRTRELGLLRALGASRRQVIGSVVAEAAVVGLIAAAAGFVVGIGLAEFLLWLLPRIGLTVPGTDAVVIGRTVVACAVVGIGVTVVAALAPALRAARTPPVAAIANLRPRGNAPLIRRAIVGTLVLAAGIAAMAFGLTADLQIEYAVAVTFVGSFGVFLGVVVIGPLFVRRLAELVGRPLPTVLGVTGTLARENAKRNPRRTSATAAALVVGLALVSLVSIFAHSVKSSVRSSLTDSVRADFIISAPGFTAFAPRVELIASSVPGVDAIVALRFANAQVNGQAEMITGATIDGIDDVFALGFTAGGTEGLGDGGVILSEPTAETYGVTVGDRLSIWFPRLGPQDVPVVGVYEHRRVSGSFPVDIVVGMDEFEAGFGGAQQDTLVYVTAQPGQVGTARRDLELVLASRFPNVEVSTVDEYRLDREATVDQFLNVFLALLFLSEVIAILGIVNTLMLSVYERTREIGLLRVVGMTRRQVRRMIRGEAVVIAIIGSLVGVVVGLVWGWAVVTALGDQFVDRLSVPVAQLGLFVVVFAIAGVIAAMIPAWSASRLDVLEAIATE
ncbi:MAG TPA: FtsX-like permease family protein [Acidimicrobiia bacterium]|nr:FtsX-like permease family protein [Acidimicrobiia bacterium]